MTQCDPARKRYRILLVSREYPPDTGGIGALTSTLAPALARRGHDVHVLSCRPGQARSDEYESGFWLHRRGQVRIRGLRRLWKARHSLIRIEAALSGWLEYRRLHLRFDIVHAGNYMAEGLFFGLSRSCPLLVWLYTHSLINAIESGWRLGHDVRWMDYLERLTAARADVVCAGSQLHLSVVQNSGWLKRTSVRVVLPPVDIAFWRGLPGPETADPVVLQVGRLESRKRPEVGFLAVAKAASGIPGARVVFAGRNVDTLDGLPYDEWLRRRGEELACEVHVLGEVSPEDLRTWYGRARVCIVPSSHESFGLVVGQAMAAGRPVVTTDSVGASQLLDGRGGQVVPRGDVDAMAAALRPFLVDAALAKQVGDQAREIAEAELDPSAVAARLEDAYAEAIEVWKSRGRISRLRKRRPSTNH